MNRRIFLKNSTTQSNMKLFIWNDYRWKLVDRLEKCDIGEFVVVRKLFVQWEEKNGRETIELIREHFETYGKIESVKPLAVKTPSTPAIHEAYVTFAQSDDAYKAFMANRHDSKATKVLPADTWRQPGVQLARPEDINFRHHTAHRCHDPSCTDDKKMVCDLSEMSLNDRGHFGEFAFEVKIDQRSCMKLKTIRERGRQMKSRVQSVIMRYNMEPDGKYDNVISNDEYFKRVIQVLSTCVGDEFDEMTIMGVKAISIELLRDLAPLLRPLETFTFQAESNAAVMYALPAYCPNVEVLLVDANSWGDCFTGVPKNWPSLSQLVLKGNLNVASDTESGAELCRFIEVNKHLSSVEIELIVDGRLCKTIAMNLKDLESLSFICATYDDLNSILDVLTDLKHLSVISITILTVKNELGAMVACAKRLKQMKQLQTVTLLQNFNPTSMRQDKLKEHLACLVKIHEDCDCHSSDRVAEFGLGSAEVKLPKDKQVLVTVVNVKDANSSIGKVKQAKVIIDAFKVTMLFYPNKIHTIKMNMGDHCKFINVCST